MEIQRKKELLQAYRNRRPEMGVISFRCSATDEVFFTAASDIPAKINRLRFQLSAGSCPNKQLQALWSKYGESAFVLQVERRLKYEDPLEDHTEELDTLYELCLLENPQGKRIEHRRKSDHG